MALEAAMGLASVPMSSVPPAFTVILPPTKVRAEVTARLYRRVPLMVVVLATAEGLSNVTVVPAAITTGLQLPGTVPTSQVLVKLHEEEATLVMVEQPTA